MSPERLFEFIRLSARRLLRLKCDYYLGAKERCVSLSGHSGWCNSGMSQSAGRKKAS